MAIPDGKEVFDLEKPCIICESTLYYEDKGNSIPGIENPYRCASCDNYDTKDGAEVERWKGSDLFLWHEPLPKEFLWTDTKKYNYPRIVTSLCNRYNFITNKLTKEIYVYDWVDGYYKKEGELIIEAELSRAFGEPKMHFIREVKNMIRIATYRNPDCWLDTIHLNSRKNINAKWLNFKNCIYNIQTGLVYPHSPGFLFLSQIPIDYNPKATCPNITDFLHETIGQEQLSMVFEWFGYNLYSSLSVQKSLLCIGTGSNGKSTFLSLLRNFIGHANCTSVTLHDLTGTNQFKSYSLYGKKSNIQGDLKNDVIEDVNAYKKLTGDDPIQAEQKHKDPFDFINYAKISCAGNNAPIVKEKDRNRAFFRRWLILKFTKVFPPGDFDALLGSLTTEQELSGLLNLAIEGLKDLLTRGNFSFQTNWKITKDAWLCSSQPHLVFFEHHLQLEDIEEIPDPFEKESIYKQFQSFCHDSVVNPPDSSFFNRRVKKYFPGILDERKQSNGIRSQYWRNLVFQEDSSYKIGGIPSPRNVLLSNLDKQYRLLGEIECAQFRASFLKNHPDFSAKTFDECFERILMDGDYQEPRPGVLKKLE